MLLCSSLHPPHQFIIPRTSVWIGAIGESRTDQVDEVIKFECLLQSNEA